jgi:hypothetical protein
MAVVYRGRRSTLPTQSTIETREFVFCGFEKLTYSSQRFHRVFVFEMIPMSRGFDLMMIVVVEEALQLEEKGQGLQEL